MSRKDQAYDYIRKRIITGNLKDGTPILENDLSEELHMSRTPIREALRDLEAEGAVVSYAFRGTFVTALTPYDVEDIFDLRLSWRFFHTYCNPLFSFFRLDLIPVHPAFARSIHILGRLQYHIRICMEQPVKKSQIRHKIRLMDDNCFFFLFHMISLPFCSIHSEGLLFSYRASGLRTGYCFRVYYRTDSLRPR